MTITEREQLTDEGVRHMTRLGYKETAALREGVFYIVRQTELTMRADAALLAAESVLAQASRATEREATYPPITESK